MKNHYITKARNDENTKEKMNLVLSNFRVFVISSVCFRLVRVRLIRLNANLCAPNFKSQFHYFFINL